jgi:hypothetical protein
MIGTLLTEWSARLDGLTGVDEGTHGTEEWAKQAVLAVVEMKLDSIYNNTPLNTREMIAVMEKFIKQRERRLSPVFYKRTPRYGTNDSTEDWATDI